MTPAEQARTSDPPPPPKDVERLRSQLEILKSVKKYGWWWPGE